MNRTAWFLLALAAFVTGLMTVPARSQDTDAAKLEKTVRADFFAGFSGDREAFARGMKTTEAALTENPKNATALVWHGSGLFYLSGQAFNNADMEKGQELWSRGLGEMDEAVKMQPDASSTRVPRGSTMLYASRVVPDEMREELLKRAVADFRRIFELRQNTLANASTHAKGELLMGLAEAYDESGKKEEAMVLVRRVAAEMNGTPYADRARLWLEKGPLPLTERTCIGCHQAQSK